MSILKLIYLCTVVSYLLIMILTSLVCRSRFKKMYPNLITRKETILEKIVPFVRLFLIAICPIVNIIMTMIMIFKYEVLVTEIVEKVAEEAEEKEKRYE